MSIFPTLCKTVSDTLYLYAHWLLPNFLNSISWHNDSIAYSYLPSLAPSLHFIPCLKPSAIKLKNPLGAVPFPTSLPFRNAHQYLPDNYSTLYKSMENETDRTCLIRWVRLLFDLHTCTNFKPSQTCKICWWHSTNAF